MEIGALEREHSPWQSKTGQAPPRETDALMSNRAIQHTWGGEGVKAHAFLLVAFAEGECDGWREY